VTLTPGPPSDLLSSTMEMEEALRRDEVALKVRELLAETLHRDVAEVSLDDRLEDLGVASIDLITLVFELEDAFGRTLEDEDVAGLTTVGSVVDFLVAGGVGGAGD
jgi:acyl carrier protein